METLIRTGGGRRRRAAQAPSNGAGLRTQRRGRLRYDAVLLASVLALVSCAHAPVDPEARAEFQKNNDPAEPTNRAIFGANQYVDRNVLRPVARSYATYVPGAVRRSLHNFASNLEEPSTAVNDVLQGNVSRAWNTTQRFVVNTTVGGAGLFDVATEWHRPHHYADFGETLGVWNIDPGPVVQLPLFGSSNVRDTIGKVGGIVLDPLTFVGGSTLSTVTAVSGGVKVVDGRSRMLPTTDSLERSSLDYYATLRSAMAQRRAYLVAQAKVGAVREEQRPPDLGLKDVSAK